LAAILGNVQHILANTKRLLQKLLIANQAGRFVESMLSALQQGSFLLEPDTHPNLFSRDGGMLGSHFLGRALRAQGHDVKLIPAQFVKSNKNDFLDAEAIAEAVGRQNMRFVPIKTDDQLDLQALHRVRDRLITRRTSVINQLRAFLLERGLVFAKSPAKLRERMPEILENAEEDLTPRMRNLLALLWNEWKDLEFQIVQMNDEVEQIASSDAACQRLRQIPGIGPLVATAIVAARGASSLRGWAWCRSSTRPAARRSWLASVNAATSTCARS
jgi:transposase